MCKQIKKLEGSIKNTRPGYFKKILSVCYLFVYTSHITVSYQFTKGWFAIYEILEAL